MGQYNFLGLLNVTWQTVEMLLISSVFIIIFGLIIGICMYITSPSFLVKKSQVITAIHYSITIIVNVLRALPFIVLVFILIPFTKLLVGTFIGVIGAIPPLVISASPFFAVIVYNSLSEVDKDKVESLRAFGANLPKILLIVIRENLSSLIRGLSITLITLTGFIAMAGIVGAGGLGQYAQLAFNANRKDWMWYAVIAILIIVLIILLLGETVARKINHKVKINR